MATIFERIFGSSASDGSDPVALAAEEPKALPAPARQPRGGSGRGHTRGFLELEEFNLDLQHPASHTIFDKMYRTDGDVRQAVTMALNPILGGVWDVEPYGGDEADDQAKEIAATLQWALFEQMDPNLLGHLEQFLPVLLRSGFVAGERIWKVAVRDGKELLVPDYIGLRLPRSIWKFSQDDHERLRSITQYLPAGTPAQVAGPESGAIKGGATGDGESETFAKDLIYYRVGAEGDNWEGVSLLRPAYKHWYFKDLIERIDAVGQEREALGVPVLYPPASADDPQLDKMEIVLQNFRTAKQGYIVMPGMKAGTGTPDGTGWLMELMGFDRTGSGRDPMPSLEYHGGKISASFIEEFMRLGHGEGSSTAGGAKQQADPFLLSIEVLNGQIERVIKAGIVAPFVAYNYGPQPGLPAVKNSLIDSSTLSQLADFALKLTQVGALLPDKRLEAFFRKRGDLPPMDPEAVKERGDDDPMIRRNVTGANVQPTPKDEADAAAAEKLATAKGQPESPAKAGGAGPSTPRKSGAPKGPAGAGKGRPRGAAHSLDDAIVPMRFTSYRYPDAWELAYVDLDMIEDTMDDLPRMLEHECSPHVFELARGHVDAHGQLAVTLQTQLAGVYDLGAAQLRDELAAQGFNASGALLDAGARDRGREHLVTRAQIAADRVELAVRSAAVGHDLAHGQEGRALAAAERGGRAALRSLAHDHAVPALVHGRHDEAMALSEGAHIVALYTSILDKNTCGHCFDANDGVERELDDPVRLEHRPPNPHCESLDSGFNRCRCFEVFKIVP